MMMMMMMMRVFWYITNQQQLTHRQQFETPNSTRESYYGLVMIVPQSLPTSMSNFSLFPHNFRLAKFFFHPSQRRRSSPQLSHIYIYIYTSQCERSTKISLFILDNDDAVDVIQNHILAFTHTSLNVIFIGMFTTIPPPPLETESERNCKNGVPTTDIQNYKARKLWFHEERKGFCATFNTHTQITSHTINLMEWSFSSFHHQNNFKSPSTTRPLLLSP